MIFATDLVPQLGTFSMAADTRGQFHEWSKEQYVVRNSRCPLKLLPNNAPTLTRELSALSTSQTSRNEKVPKNDDDRFRNVTPGMIIGNRKLLGIPHRSAGRAGAAGAGGRGQRAGPGRGRP